MNSDASRRSRIPRWALSLAIPVVLLGLVLSEQSARTADENAAPSATADPFAVPENPSELSLNLFMTRLMRMRPDGDSDEERRAHFARVEAAADQLLKLDLETDLLLKAVELKQGSLMLEEQFGDETAAGRLRTFLDKLLEDPRPEVVADARRRDEVYRIQHLDGMSDEQRQQMVDDVAGRLKKGVEPATFNTAFRLAGALEKVDVNLAIAAYNTFAGYIARGPRPTAADDVNYQEAAEVMRAAARRLDLPGNPIEVTGTTFAGDAFNIADLKGKVVLIDFWATWCAPCVAELPHIQELYEKHHKDGFEVVGISLDESDTKLADFLHERQVPWITLFEPDPAKRGFNTPVVNRYGINELPTAILVDREGKVVSVHAFDEGLAELLEKHL